MKKGYQYYDDGRLKFTQDQLVTNSKFDRLYKYDHVGRITSALSGAEARGGTTDDRPYNETLSYDAMDHLTLRDVRQWDRNISTGNLTYINNRIQFWRYDADGRLLAGTTGVYTYDAAGQISMFGDVGYETDQQLDGDGRRIKSVQRRYDMETDQWVVDKTTYYIHSSVIGQVISEVSPQGAKERSFVFAGSSVLAVQTVDVNSSQQVSWKHYDPSNASYRSTDSSGTSVGAAEMDPFGADAGLFKPFTWPQPTSSGKIEPYYGIPELNSTYGGCELDRVPIPCEIRNSLMEAGGVAHAETIRTGRGSRMIDHSYESHGLGLYTTYTYKIDDFGEYSRERVLMTPQNTTTTPGFNSDACGALAEEAHNIAVQAVKNAGGDFAKALREFDNNLSALYVGRPLRTLGDAWALQNGADVSRARARGLLGETGFEAKFQEGRPQNDQTHHFVTYFSGGLNSFDSAAAIHKNVFEDNQPDIDLADAAFKLGDDLRNEPQRLKDIAYSIKMRICNNWSRPVQEWPR
jgi:hypothetical protein